MDRRYKFYRKQLGSDRREITEDEVRELLRARFPGSLETIIAYMKAGEKIEISGVLLVAEVVA